MRIAIMGVMLLAAAGQDESKLPVTPKKPIVDEYHGVKVTDEGRACDAIDQGREVPVRKPRGPLARRPKVAART